VGYDNASEGGPESYNGACGPCPPTDCPVEVDIPALREKYRQERDKRIRSEGQQQYVTHDEGEGEIYEIDPYMPVVPRAPMFDEIDVAVLGAGWSGTLAAYHLKQAGVQNVRIIDWAGDFGGVWYWNRYPGIQCDNDAYCYMSLLEETGYIPSKKFADGWEIQEHFQRIARQFGLYEHAVFHTLIRSLRWDAETRRWRIATNRGDEFRARFVVMAGGPLNRPKLPVIAGMKAFQGHTFHTARWDYDYTGGDRKTSVLDKLADKRVALIGTGATALQVVPYLGLYAKQAYVIQRTPSCVDTRQNPPTDPDWIRSLQPGWHQARRENFHRAAIDGLLPGEADQICDFFTEIRRNLAAKRAADGWRDMTPEEYGELYEREDYQVMERLRRHISHTVKDPATAELLKPWYRHGCKRVGSSSAYLQTFNLPNVKLLDVSATRGLERMTPNGFVAGGVEYEADCVIFASGYDVTGEIRGRWGIETIEGRDGLSIYDHWEDRCRTLHGMTAHGFPNQFFIGFYQGGFSATVTETFGNQGRHIAYIVKQALDRGATLVEPTAEAVEAWCEHISEVAIDNTQFQRECTPSYLNNEGEKKLRWYIGETYGPGFEAFNRVLKAWRDEGDLQGLALEA
jgi:cyclohexanone monooxygenase